MLDGRENGEELECGATDRISKLPDLIIHYILSFLPTMEVVRMSLLSKRWRRMCYTAPTLNLRDDMHFRKERFEKLVDNCWKWREIMGTRYIVDSCITRFKLKMPYYYGCKSRVDEWLNLAVKNQNSPNLSFV